MLLDEFSKNISKNREIIFDTRDNSQIGLRGLKEKIALLQRYFSFIRHGREDKVILFLENSTDYVAVLIALFDVDIIVVPLNPLLNRLKTTYFVRHCRADFIITTQEILLKNEWLKTLDLRIILTQEIFKKAEAINIKTSYLSRKPAIKERDLKFILYTSGTVGNPKGVMHSRRTAYLKILNPVELLHFKPQSHFFSFLPSFAGIGMFFGMLVPLFSGCKIYIGKFDAFMAPRFWNLVKKYRINHFTAVPSILALLKEQIGDTQKEDLRCLQSIFSTASQLPQPIFDWYRDFLGILIHNCYGLTEANLVSVNMDPARKEKSNCIGKTFGGEIGIFNKSGNRLGYNQIGQLWLKGPYNMLGYFKNRKATNSCITTGGFLKTGDTGYIDPTGKIFILDRIKNIIIKNGINVYPQEIDQLFLKHPDVRNSFSFGVADKNYGEKIVTALIVVDRRRQKDKYLQYAMKNLPVFLVPDQIFFVKSLPRGQTGKVLVNVIRQQYLKRRMN